MRRNGVQTERNEALNHDEFMKEKTKPKCNCHLFADRHKKECKGVEGKHVATGDPTCLNMPAFANDVKMQMNLTSLMNELKHGPQLRSKPNHDTTKMRAVLKMNMQSCFTSLRMKTGVRTPKEAADVATEEMMKTSE